MHFKNKDYDNYLYLPSIIDIEWRNSSTEYKLQSILAPDRLESLKFVKLEKSTKINFFPILK